MNNQKVPASYAVTGIDGEEIFIPNLNRLTEDELKSEGFCTFSEEVQIEQKNDKAKAGNSKKDDLKVIEGIGPALEKMLNENNISTYDHLANHTVVQLENMLDKAGPRFRVHVPETWPEQASLLRDGKTDAFKALTERPKGGRWV
jgi:hypothetical protein